MIKFNDVDLDYGLVVGKTTNTTYLKIKSSNDVHHMLKIVDYPTMVSRRVVEFSPIHIKDNKIVINNHIIVDDDKVYLNDWYMTTHINNSEEVIRRSLIIRKAYPKLFKYITGDLPEDNNRLTLKDLEKLVVAKDRIPQVEKYQIDNIRLWEYLDNKQVVMSAVARKMYQILFENLTESRLRYLIRKLNLSKHEAINNEHQARAAKNKIEIPWESEYISKTPIESNLVMSDTPQSDKAGRVVSIAASTDNKGRNISYLQQHNKYIKHLAPTRRVVARYINQQSHLVNEEFKDNIFKPLVARMTYYGWTTEDGCVISKSLADKLTSMEVSTDKFIVKYPNITAEKLGYFEPDMYDDLMKLDAPFVNRKSTIGTYYSETTGQIEELTSTHTGIITGIHQVETEVEGEFMVIIETTTIYKLEKGDKIADLHGNKTTVALIQPDDKMPISYLHNKRIDLIVPPWIGKRATASRLLEEEEDNGGKLSMVEDKAGDSIHFKIPVAHVKYIRLHHYAKKKLTYSNRTITNYLGLVPKGKGLYNFADGMYHMLATKSYHLLDEILERTYETNSIEVMNDYLKSLGFTFKNHRILKDNGSIFFDAPDNDVIINRTFNPKEPRIGTILDSRLETSHGWIELPRNITIVNYELARRITGSIHPTEISRRLMLNKRAAKMNVKKQDIMRYINRKTYIRIPAGLKVFVTATDKTAMNEIQALLDQLIGQINNFNKWRSYSNISTEQFALRTNNILNLYLSNLNSKIFGKNGIVRNTIHPRTRFSATAVLSANPLLNLDEVEIPIQLVRAFIRDADFRTAYKLDENMDLEEINRALKENDKRILLMRNPAHQTNNVLGLKVRVSYNHTFNINPAIVKMLDGDFDGDTGVIYTPISEEAQKDLYNLRPDQYRKMLITNKGLEGLDLYDENGTLKDFNTLNDEIHQIYIDNTGITETKEDVENRHDKNKVAQFNKYLEGEYDKTVDFKDEVEAAEKFSFMKNGTANGGNIGNLCRNIFPTVYGYQKGIILGNFVYHTIVQKALDSKNSLEERHKINALFDTFRANKMDRETFEKNLSYAFSKRTISLIWKGLTKNNKWRGPITSIIANEFPLAHIVNSGNITDLYLANEDYENGDEEKSVVSYLLHKLDYK